MSPPAFADEQFSDSSLPSLTASSSEDEVSGEDLFDEYGFRRSSRDLRSAALAGSEDFIDMGSVTGVELQKTWTIKFSRTVNLQQDVESITIYRPVVSEFVPVRVRLGTTSNHITVAPGDKFIGDNDYELRVILKNGKHYKKSFRTVSEHRNADIEPNNTRGSAVELQLNEIISGNTSKKYGDYDPDSYKIIVPEYGYLRIAMKAPMRRQFYFYNSLDGKFRYKTDGHSEATADWIIPVSPGTYYVTIEKYIWTDPDSSYIIENSFTPSSYGADQADGSYALAKPLSFGSPAQGLLGFLDDNGGQNLDDFYKIVLDQSAPVKISAKDLKGKTFRIDLYGERGTDGDVIAYSEGVIPLIEQTLSPGTYYLRIRDDKDDRTWKALEYEIEAVLH